MARLAPAASLRVATRTAFAGSDPSFIEKRGSVCAIVLQICNAAVSVVTPPARFAFRPRNFLTRSCALIRKMPLRLNKRSWARMIWAMPVRMASHWMSLCVTNKGTTRARTTWAKTTWAMPVRMASRWISRCSTTSQWISRKLIIHRLHFYKRKDSRKRSKYSNKNSHLSIKRSGCRP